MPVSTGTHILILSGDPMFAALLGMFAELAGHPPAFAQPGERPEEALIRVRPLLVVLIDSDFEPTRTDLFLATAARRRVGVAILARRAERDAAESPVASNVPVFDVPTDFDRFRTVLRATAECKWWLGRGDRRQASEDRPADAGAVATAVYVDAEGRRWHVVDRRGAERRSADRLFVAEDGETRRCELASGEEADILPEQLQRQLARATKT